MNVAQRSSIQLQQGRSATAMGRPPAETLRELWHWDGFPSSHYVTIDGDRLHVWLEADGGWTAWIDRADGRSAAIGTPGTFHDAYEARRACLLIMGCDQQTVQTWPPGAVDLHHRGAGNGSETGAYRLGTPVDTSAFAMPNRAAVDGPESAFDALPPGFADGNREQVHVLLLDQRCRLLAGKTLYRGTAHSCPVRPAELFREAIMADAASIIVVHNHPSGDVLPSSNDREMTERLAGAGAMLDIPLHDHLIVATGERNYYSLRSQESRLWS